MTRLTRYHALTFMVLALLVAAILRLPQLTEVPPGVHYDEAAYGLNAGDIGLRGDRPVFIPSFTGREPLFLYAAGGMAAALGNTLFALRLTAAFFGLLTVAATYRLGREMLADRRIALLAAALLAVSFWHVLFSRLGFRVISQPLLMALAVAALFRGLRGGRWPWLWLAGVLIGLTAYTYLAARLFPVLLAFALLPLLLDPRTRALRARQLLLVGLVAFLTALPLLAYFAAHPDAFWVRIGQVAPGAADEGLSLTESLLRSFGMFFLAGDPYLRFNLPGRPLFDFATGGLLLVGWIILVARYRRLYYDWQRAAVLLLLLAPLVMILPTALAVNEIVPSNLRALGLIPFVFFLPPIGLITLLRDVERRFGRPNLTVAVQVIALLLLWAGGQWTQHQYFRVWAADPELIFVNDGDMTAIAAHLDRTLAELPPEARPAVYVASPHYRHPTLAFLSANYDAVKWLPGSHALVFPAAGDALYYYPAGSPAPAWAVPYLESGGPPEIVLTDGGRELFRVYRLSPGASHFLECVAPSGSDAAGDVQRTEEGAMHGECGPTGTFAGLLRLDGSTTLPDDFAQTGRAATPSGAALPLTLFWTVEAVPPAGQNATTFVHLEDLNGHRWSQVEQDAYPAEQWAAGETILQRVDVPVPPGAPPGDNGLYRLRFGLFDPASGGRLPFTDAAGGLTTDAALSEGVAISAAPPPEPLPIPPFPVSRRVVAGLTFLGYERGAEARETGEMIDVGLWWSAEEPLPSLLMNLTLVGVDNGVVRPFGRAQPFYNLFPFSQWPAPIFVIDRQTARIPDDVATGDYRLRLELFDSMGRPLYATDLGPLAITQTAREFTPPPLAVPVGASFGGEIALLGYTLSEGDGEQTLELVWQAEAQPAADYTVFVHVLNADGTCCVWQADAMPRGGAYPTSRWVAGEVVTDTYAIVLPADLAAGEYAVEVGLYRAETGERLPALIDGEPVGDAVQLGPLKKAN
ncbi:MAG: glycosyltransferase family 39 protein [Candidatus Promineofilum sp.]|nr:glycosyltransferase family 39 protein [Promineifilum sp.]